MRKILLTFFSALCCLSFVTALSSCGSTPKPKPTTYTVTFNGNGGTLVSGDEVQTVTQASEIVAPTYDKDDYNFTGWDKDLSLITTTTTVTAQWEFVFGPETEVKKLEITQNPTKMSYQEGDTFDTTGMVVTATYHDDVKRAVTDYSFRPSGLLKTTDKEIEVAYGHQIIKLSITVSPASFSGTPLTIEAEDSTLTGVFNAGTKKGQPLDADVIKSGETVIGNASNDHCIWNFAIIGNCLTIKFESPNKGIAELKIRVAARKAVSEKFDNWYDTLVNNEKVLTNATISDSDPQGWYNFSTITITISINAGLNQIDIKPNNSKSQGGNLDCFTITPTSGSLVDKTVASFTY